MPQKQSPSNVSPICILHKSTLNLFPRFFRDLVSIGVFSLFDVVFGVFFSDIFGVFCSDISGDLFGVIGNVIENNITGETDEDIFPYLIHLEH